MGDFKEVCEKAIAHYGEENQIKKCMEELQELLVELQIYIANLDSNYENDMAVVDEIADVVVTLAQMTMIFGESAVSERIDFKLKRLEDRMKI